MKKLLKGFLKKIQKVDILGLIIFFSTLLIYVHNLSPSVYGGDSGDLLTAAVVKGVPHPSGYPLYTLIGILFLKLPIKASFAWKFGLASAILSAFSVLFLYLTIKEITKDKLLSLAFSFTLAFTFPFWLYAEIVEVFSLHHFFITLISLLTVKYLMTLERKYFYYLAFALGLSLTNNLSILLLFPAVFLSLISKGVRNLLKPETIFLSLFLFVISLSPYIYIPLSARQSPAVNWNNPVNLENFLHLLLRKDYGWGVERIVKKDFDLKISNINLFTYFNYWLAYLNISLFLTAFLGIIFLTKNKNYSLLILFFLSFLLFGPLFIFYSQAEFGSLGTIGVMEKFYTSSSIFILILSVLGIKLLQEFSIQKLKKPFFIKTVKLAIIFTVLIIPASYFFKNFQKTNLSKIYLGDSLGIDILTSLPENSVLLLTDDSIAFSSIYAKNVLGIRKDVEIPGIYDGFKILWKETGLSEEEVKKRIIEKKAHIDQELFPKILSNLVKKYPVYSDSPLQKLDDESELIIPVSYGILFKLETEKSLKKMSKEDYLKKIEEITKNYHLNQIKENEEIISEHLYLSHIRRAYAVGFINISNFFEYFYFDKDLSQKFKEMAKEIDPILELQ